MTDMVKKNLLLPALYNKGLIKKDILNIRSFPTYKEAKENNMNVFTHCFCTDHKDK